MEHIGAQAPHLTEQEFLEAVLRLEPRVAAFDCDGTLWSGDAGERFFDWEIKRNLVTAEMGRAMRARHAEYRAGKVSEEQMCGEMVTMHKGLSEDVVMKAATEFMEHAFPGHVFPEMKELVRRLHENGCDIWAVSSSNEWVIRAGMKQFGIPKERVLAGKAAVENGVVTDRLVRMPSGPGKAEALRDVARKNIDAAFGNSRWDVDMLAHATHGFAVNPNPDLKATARLKGWTVYFPDGTRP
ncbi:MAG TPA: haloacid dehalogenase-like hydrolase [Candidatus Sulfotelmatobacter sp.]|jgi:phosphoserine phosphatase|nr:haloacid dehalogenase-like hydrolase [Candidatus Sulfotelmatobacter sp.]